MFEEHPEIQPVWRHARFLGFYKTPPSVIWLVIERFGEHAVEFIVLVRSSELLWMANQWSKTKRIKIQEHLVQRTLVLSFFVFSIPTLFFTPMVF
jgi:hypothetical protein